MSDGACVARRMARRSAFEAAIRSGATVVFPADTVYGLACDPSSAAAVQRMYALKGRAPDKPAAVMFFSVDAAAGVLDALGPRTAAAAHALLPGAVTLLVGDADRRFPLAGGDGVLGLRVPDLPELAGVSLPVLQTSANLAGGPEALRLADVPESIRAGAGLVLDGGELGEGGVAVPSTVIALTRYEDAGAWSIVRAGAVSSAVVAAALADGPERT
ncbi:MAG TPA: Sua5/YciO/YrdC/YwlC family protein [Solirubrobacteraceae bacterium]|nr:Sua5/YciO/YrdC/YwlC family protein [Solirubrobacteraceae bacterium]